MFKKGKKICPRCGKDITHSNNHRDVCKAPRKSGRKRV